ncbi:MAG: hypothetical protein KDD89_03750, partial [Anaerolineales bacterium]|nr:hypothetical protein [Anaerolineales bacterium]
QNGFLVPPGDVNALTNALNKILQDADQRRSFGQFSKQLADERYNWKHVGSLIRHTILEVLTAKKTP